MTVQHVLEQVTQLVSGGDWELIQNEHGQFRLYSGEYEFCVITALHFVATEEVVPLGAAYEIGEAMNLGFQGTQLVVTAADNHENDDSNSRDMITFLTLRATFERLSTKVAMAA